MPRVSKIQYNPKLSVAENAKNNGVTDAAIRYYIRVNNVDRNHQRKQNIIDTCRKYLKKHPTASQQELYRETGYSVSTIRKYWEFITTKKKLGDFNQKKLQDKTKKYNDILSAIPIDVIRSYLAEHEPTQKAKKSAEHESTQKAKKRKVDTDELKLQIDELKEIEKNNSQSLQCLPPPTIDDLERWEEYDASKYLCYAFRKKEDKRKGVWVPFGNMNSGFGFDLQGIHFNNSEAAYISGIFSNDVPEHVALQEILIANTNGKLAKGDIRFHNKDKARKDWETFNVQWMLYVIWVKVQRNEWFRNLLLSVPEGATIIEDTSFKKKAKVNDTSDFWGARNIERKNFIDIVEKVFIANNPDAIKARKKEALLEEYNCFTDYGTFRGCNTMGKILTICRKCLAEGTEPPIDYELLKSKNIHLLGKPVSFDEPIRQVKNSWILGTITGDMIGKPYEMEKNAIHTTEFPLFERKSKYTDDTVLTIAIMDWLMSDKEYTWEVLADKFVHYGTRYRFKGRDRCYAKPFAEWLLNENRELGRKSLGNGAAMRVSPVGWYFDTVEEVERVAEIQASLTHNTPEAIQGAQVAAVAVLLARQGKTMDEIKSFIEDRYGWHLTYDMDAYRESYERNFLCVETVEGALVSFLCSTDFESSIRNAVSLGSDSDTVAAITGSIAEAFYGGVPVSIKHEVLRRSIPDEFKNVLTRFNEVIGR